MAEGFLARLRRRLAALAERLPRLPWRRVARVPTILQMEAVECGAASLGMVLAHYGKWVPIEELRVACGVSRDGSRAGNLVRAAKTFGLDSLGLKRDADRLRDLPMPAILHWNFSHFLVLEGFDGDRIYVNDPALGPSVLRSEDLDESYTGVVLVFEPGADFKKSGRPPSPLRSLGGRMRGTAPSLALVLLSGLLLLFPNLAAPAYTKVFIDSVLLGGHQGWLPSLLLIMVATALLIAGIGYFQQSHLLRLETRLSLTSSSAFLWHVLRLPLSFFNHRFAGDISTRVASNDIVAQLLSRDLASNLIAAATALLLALVMFRYDAVLTVVALAVASLNVLAARLVARHRRDGSRRLVLDRGLMNYTALGGLQNIETVKASASENGLFGRWSGYQAKVVNTRQELERRTQALDAVPPLLGAVSTALILGVGSLRVIDGQLSLGGLIAFQALTATFLLPIQRLVGLLGRWQTIDADLMRLDDVLRHPVDSSVGGRLDREAETAGAAAAAERYAGRLEVRNLTFGYSPLDPPLFRDFSLTVEPGRRVALVGPTGSGKSTLVQLISGLYSPAAGEILFDGRPRRDFAPGVLARAIATVDQSISLFAGSLRDNLTLWDKAIPLAEVIAAARDAVIHDAITARPGGYDSQVQEGGANWSGGQQQRLEIARALVSRPRLLVLDEATSALDPANEEEIDRNLRRRGCTCLIVSHRLSTIRDADEIVVLDRGRIVQQGTHDQLILDAAGLYARLVRSAEE